MKAVLLAPLPPPSGGIATLAKRIQKAKLKNGWKTVIVDEKVIGRDIFGENTRISLPVEIKRCFKIWRDLWIALNDSEVRVVHSNIPAGVNGMLRETICAWISKLRGRKFIIHYHCTVPNMVNGKRSLSVFKVLTNVSDACIVLNSKSEAFVQNHSRTPVSLIPNFVSVQRTNSFTPHALEDKYKCRAVYIGGVIEEKGCLEIIEAAKGLQDVEFRLVGSTAPEIRSYAGMPDNVVLCGETNAEGVQQELAQADIFVFMSHFHREGFSVALAEAMAAGLPCVVSDWAANADMIEDKGGFVVPIHDVKGLSDGIRKLVESEELRNRMGNWNVEKVRRFYLQDQVIAKYVDLYERVIAG